jgi:hypothetical protein
MQAMEREREGMRTVYQSKIQEFLKHKQFLADKAPAIQRYIANANRSIKESVRFVESIRRYIEQYLQDEEKVKLFKCAHQWLSSSTHEAMTSENLGRIKIILSNEVFKHGYNEFEMLTWLNLNLDVNELDN